MTQFSRATAAVEVVLVGCLVAVGCSEPVPESEVVGGTSIDSSGLSAWEIACVAPPSSSTQPDSATALLLAVADLWNAERHAFRAYQGTFCDDCGMFEVSAPQFFASSIHLTDRVVERFPASAAAACAQGMMYLRKASLGEGSYDMAILDEAAAMFQRGLSLNPTSGLVSRIQSELNDIEAERPPT